MALASRPCLSGVAPALGELDPSMLTFFSVSPPTAAEASVFI